MLEMVAQQACILLGMYYLGYMACYCYHRTIGKFLSIIYLSIYLFNLLMCVILACVLC